MFTFQDCSRCLVRLENQLQSMRQSARILFTCLSTDSTFSQEIIPSKQLDVDELYKRAVKLVRDYEASNVGCEILAAWRRLQTIADKIGRLQAG